MPTLKPCPFCGGEASLTEKPTEPGWYWMRRKHKWGMGDPEVMYLVWSLLSDEDDSQHLLTNPGKYHVGVDLLDSEWAGPIPPPAEPEEAENG